MQILTGSEAGLLGIFGDVAAKVLEMLRAADQVVETLRLPEAATPAYQRIDPTGRELLPRFALGFDLGIAQQTEEHVNVVGHDDVVAQVVASTVKVLQRRRHEPGRRGVAQLAGADSAVQVLHELPGEGGVELAVQVGHRPQLRLPLGRGGIDAVAPQPVVPLPMPETQQGLRDRVGRAKCDEVGHARLKPMRQGRIVDGVVLPGIEELERGGIVADMVAVSRVEVGKPLATGETDDGGDAYSSAAFCTGNCAGYVTVADTLRVSKAEAAEGPLRGKVMTKGNVLPRVAFCTGTVQATVPLLCRDRDRHSQPTAQEVGVADWQFVEQHLGELLQPPQAAAD